MYVDLCSSLPSIHGRLCSQSGPGMNSTSRSTNQIELKRDEIGNTASLSCGACLLDCSIVLDSANSSAQTASTAGSNETALRRA